MAILLMSNDFLCNLQNFEATAVVLLIRDKNYAYDRAHANSAACTQYRIKQFCWLVHGYPDKGVITGKRIVHDRKSYFEILAFMCAHSFSSTDKLS